MKYIKEPPPVALVDTITGKEVQVVKFRDFVLLALLNDRRCSENYNTLKLARQVDDALLQAKPGTIGGTPGVLKLEVKAWELLKSIAENPSGGVYNGYTSLGMIQLTDFIEAIIGATDQPPSAGLSSVPEEAGESPKGKGGGGKGKGSSVSA